MTGTGPGERETVCKIHRTGFVLAGGRSSRMGRDKALLPWGGTTLIERVALMVREAAGTVAILGPSARYGHLGIPVQEDLVPDCGPLGGLHAALATTSADWNLLAACDMPQLSPELLRQLLDLAEESSEPAIVPRTLRGWEPLCAVYHRRLLPEVAAAIDHKLFRMQDFVARIGARPLPLETGLPSVNTPAEWEAFH